VGEHHGLGARDAELRGEPRLEELVVGRPHERVVDHGRARRGRVLEV
ncbi:MAG: hypothetical protein AVDCRST_MAG11-662, partial [uncultured Gemmatimonadaceae bacterium]